MRTQILIMVAAFGGLLVVDQISSQLWAANNRGVCFHQCSIDVAG
jgi:hypothetical protein